MLLTLPEENEGNCKEYQTIGMVAPTSGQVDHCQLKVGNLTITVINKKDYRKKDQCSSRFRFSLKHPDPGFNPVDCMIYKLLNAG